MYKIVLAINPYEYLTEIDEKVSRFFEELGKIEDFQLQPVYVETSGFAQLRSYTKNLEMDDFQSRLQEDCVEYVKRLGLKTAAPPVVLKNKLALRSSEVDVFLKFVDQQNPDFVCMASRAKEHTSDLFLGSFVEAYLNKSQHPTFVIGPKAQVTKPLTRAFVPAEITEESKAFIRQYLKDIKLGFVKESTLFHKLTLRDYQETLWLPPLIGREEKSQEDWVNVARKTSEESLRALALESGDTSTQILVSSEISYRLVPDVILSTLEEDGAGLVVLKSSSSVFETFILGSVAKELINRATVPVLVYPYHYKV